MKTRGYETSISPILGLDTPSKSLQDNNLQKDPRGCNSNVNNNLGQLWKFSHNFDTILALIDKKWRKLLFLLGLWT